MNNPLVAGWSLAVVMLPRVILQLHSIPYAAAQQVAAVVIYLQAALRRLQLGAYDFIASVVELSADHMCCLDVARIPVAFWEAARLWRCILHAWLLLGSVRCLQHVQCRGSSHFCWCLGCCFRVPVDTVGAPVCTTVCLLIETMVAHALWNHVLLMFSGS